MTDAPSDRVNLFVIGVNKAGTSWLYALLDRHPEIFMCAEKELYYFGECYPDDLEAYHAHFPFDQPYRYFGEATPFYCHEAAVARQIHHYAPEAKVMAIVRDPVKRLHSQFYYHKQLGFIDEEAGPEALLGPEAAPLRENSRYEQMLPPFAHVFGPEQFKVVSLETASADVPAFWQELQSFLDLRPVPLPASGGRPSNATGSQAFRAVYRYAIRPIKRHAPALYRTLLRSSLMGTAKRALLRLLGTADKQALPPAVEASLHEAFQPTYQYLSGLGFSCYEEALRAPSPSAPPASRRAE